MTSKVVAQTKMRKNFYRDNYRKILTAFFFALIIILCLIVAIVFVVFTQKPSDYYATASNGHLMPLKVVARGTGLPDVK